MLDAPVANPLCPAQHSARGGPPTDFFLWERRPRRESSDGRPYSRLPARPYPFFSTRVPCASLPRHPDERTP